MERIAYACDKKARGCRLDPVEQPVDIIGAITPYQRNAYEQNLHDLLQDYQRSQAEVRERYLAARAAIDSGEIAIPDGQTGDCGNYKWLANAMCQRCSISSGSGTWPEWRVQQANEDMCAHKNFRRINATTQEVLGFGVPVNQLDDQFVKPIWSYRNLNQPAAVGAGVASTSTATMSTAFDR